jgi:hypothetical protein
VAAYDDLPGHHLLVVPNLIATTNGEPQPHTGMPSGTSPACRTW